jgi:hypothetical protein
MPGGAPATGIDRRVFPDIERIEDIYGRSNALEAGVKTQTIAR